MTGMRREIARHVVHNILDTLSNNDYVNIFTFSNTTDPLVECFDNRLVQVNTISVTHHIITSYSLCLYSMSYAMLRSVYTVLTFSIDCRGASFRFVSLVLFYITINDNHIQSVRKCTQQSQALSDTQFTLKT